jgi:aminoglycoside phosphotransferase (APT) family kinase protein
MASPDDDLERYGPGLTAWLRAHSEDGADVRVTATARPTAGYASNTILVTLSGGRADTGEPGLVLRLPPDQPTHLGDKLELQARVQNVVAAHGVPAAAPAGYEPDPTWLGTPFLTMPCVPGHVAGEVPTLDPWISTSSPELQRRMYENFTDAVAAAHAVDVVTTGLVDDLPGQGSLTDDIDTCARYLDWATDGRSPSRLVDALHWLRSTRPADEPPRGLVWGDPRIGNAIFDDDRAVCALIDWETASIGPAEFDVAWWLGLEDVAAEFLGGRIPGFPERGETLRRYEAALARPLVALDWFTTFAVVAAAGISVRLALLRRGTERGLAEADGNPLIAYAERRMSM